MKTLKVRGVTLGEGREKIICSIMDPKIEDALETMELVKKSRVDAIEYRGDWSEDVHDPAKMQDNVRRIRERLGEFPILFTFRSVNEGGHLDLPAEEYITLTKAMIDSGCLDLVDIEYWIGDERVKELIDYTRAKNVYSVYTYHNFKDTPSVEWICNYIAHGRELGADIQKCATMATSKTCSHHGDGRGRHAEPPDGRDLRLLPHLLQPQGRKRTRSGRLRQRVHHHADPARVHRKES